MITRRFLSAVLAASAFFLINARAQAQYIIPWGKRETMEHNGNLKEYFAKMTLTVK